MSAGLVYNLTFRMSTRSLPLANASFRTPMICMLCTSWFVAISSDRVSLVLADSGDAVTPGVEGVIIAPFESVNKLCEEGNLFMSSAAFTSSSALSQSKFSYSSSRPASVIAATPNRQPLSQYEKQNSRR